MREISPSLRTHLYYCCLIILLVSCGHKKTVQTTMPAHFVVKTYRTHPGKVVKLDLSYAGKLKPAGKLLCADREIPFVVEAKANRIIGYLPTSFYNKEGLSFCRYYEDEHDEQGVLVAEIKTQPKDYPSSVISVDSSKVVLSKENSQRVAREQKVLNKIYASSTPELLFDEPFELPLKSKVTSPYGTRRVYNNQLKSYHSGVDFRAPIGTPIPVSNDGLVVFVDDLFYTGLTVIVDHGLGVFTIYCHLSEFQVKKGDVLKKGDLLGLAGDTGRVTGPHLHWGVKVHGILVDGLTLAKLR